MENQNLIENSKFYKSDRELDYSLKKEKLQNELLLLEEELEEASIIKKFSLKLKIVDKKMQIDLLELVIKEQKENEEKLNMIKKDFILVEGGSYFPSFTNEEKEVFDIEVSKYPITQKFWKNFMEITPLSIIESALSDRKNIPKYIGDNKPMLIFWWDALEFCNRLSKFCNLKPVYDLSNKDKGMLKIIELDGKIVNPDEANFENTEGFRLPLEIEWEWFARGGQKALNEGSFDRYFSNGFRFGIDRDYDPDYESGSGEIYKIRDVGQIRPNQLGIYDCCKNFTEWCYDTVITAGIEAARKGDFEVEEKTKIKNGKIYVYKAKNNQDYNRRIRGGNDFEFRFYSDLYSEWYDKELGKFVIKKSIYRFISMFRVVRSIKKIQKASNTLKNIERISSKKEFKNMVFVKGGKYKPSFLSEEKEVFDIEVCKYITTQKMWLEVKEYNSAKYKGENKPIECVGFWRILSYCNKLSIKYGLEPVYDLSKCEDEILMIRQLNGKIVPLNEANFKDTEGFRLPTEIEWEWFARGGQKAIDEETFDYTYSGSNNIDEVAWYRENGDCRKIENRYFDGIPDFFYGKTPDVGLKKPNQLGLYDCSGNSTEVVHDIINVEDKNKLSIVVRGGAVTNEAGDCTVFKRYNDYWSGYVSSSFRLVRTV